MLKNNNDLRSVAYMIITSALFYYLWNYGSTLSTYAFVPLYIWLMYMGVTAAVMAHNHNHLPMWKNKWMNVLTDNWLTLFYGFPVFAWIPTHNANHHKYVNTDPDYTKTWRYSENNNIFTALTYPTVSGSFQQPVVMKFYKETYSRNKEKFFLYTLQFIVLISWIAGAFYFGGWQKALIYVIIPQQFSLFSILLFNYVQHVDADEETKYNASRNFTGVLNLMLFNNGYHTVHHIYPTSHWSDAKEEHDKIAHKIDSSLNEPSFWGYLFKSYVLAVFSDKYKVKSMRVARMEKEAEAAKAT